MTTQNSSTQIKCPNCGTPIRIGALACEECGHVFGGAGRTTKMDEIKAPKPDRASGEVILSNQKPIVLEMGTRSLTLPLAEEVTVGRRYGSDLVQPDVDLTDYGAEENGVSRMHVRIKRRGELIYIIDLGSTNGTHLNGRKLLPNGERILRDKDDLYLGRMRIRVRF